MFLTDTLPGSVVAVRILNPYNAQETLNDKLTIVDVKARDAGGRVFQIEIQRDDRTRHRCGSCLTAPYALLKMLEQRHPVLELDSIHGHG